jgi:hypothetical protein
MSIRPLGAVDDVPDHRETLVDIQSGADAGERQAQLHQRDRDRRAHAHDDGDRVEHPGHRRDIVQHAPDEGVDDFQGRYVDHDAARPIGHDALRQIVLQRHGEPVVHVDLDRDQQAVADLEDRYLAHRG